MSPCRISSQIIYYVHKLILKSSWLSCGKTDLMLPGVFLSTQKITSNVFRTVYETCRAGFMSGYNQSHIPIQTRRRKPHWFSDTVDYFYWSHSNPEQGRNSVAWDRIARQSMERKVSARNEICGVMSEKLREKSHERDDKAFNGLSATLLVFRGVCICRHTRFVYYSNPQTISFSNNTSLFVWATHQQCRICPQNRLTHPLLTPWFVLFSTSRSQWKQDRDSVVS